MNLGITINSIRKQRGINEGELAELTGLTQAYMSQIEKNKNIILEKRIVSEK